MCTILFAIKQHAEYPLVLIANRDEFYARPTEAAHWWGGEPNIFAGKDLQGGGTWMGMTKSGRWAALTNYRDPHNLLSDAPSRGDLVENFLKSTMSPLLYLRFLEQKSAVYNGFNLLVGDKTEVAYFSNMKKDPYLRLLSSGIYGLSNAFLDTPWEKVRENKLHFADLLAENPQIFPKDKAFSLLQNPKTYPDSLLPSTGVPLELERSLSALFINLPKYGTRVSSLLLLDKEGKMSLEEKFYH